MKDLGKKCLYVIFVKYYVLFCEVYRTEIYKRDATC